MEKQEVKELVRRSIYGVYLYVNKETFAASSPAYLLFILFHRSLLSKM